MNLKESFRYQKFLDTMLGAARISIENPRHALKTTKMHMRSEVNPEAKDEEEVVESELGKEYFDNDKVIQFMVQLIEEREKLSLAIEEAKKGVGFNLDAAIETNKFRHLAGQSLKRMLEIYPYKRKESGIGYKFNAEGEQVSYRYNVQVSAEEAYDKEVAKNTMKEIISDSDETSSKIDIAMVNTTVNYNPPFDVNDGFDDVMRQFIS